MDLKVILDATHEHIEKLTIKHVNQRRLCDNLCISVRQDNLRGIAPQKDGKVPLTRREHVNHVIEGHGAISSRLKISRVT